MPTQWQPGMDITASRLNVDLAVRKGSDTARDSTTTLADDPHLTVTLAASATYLIDGLIIYSATSTTDFKCAWSIPSGATGAWAPWGAGLTATTTTSDGYLIRTDVSTSFTTGYVFAGIGSPNLTSVFIRGAIVTSSTGTFAFQWAQNTSGAISTTVYANSWLRLTRAP